MSLHGQRCRLLNGCRRAYSFDVLVQPRSQLGILQIVTATRFRLLGISLKENNLPRGINTALGPLGISRCDIRKVLSNLPRSIARLKRISTARYTVLIKVRELKPV